MKIAIVGFPGCGKSTCFKAITQKSQKDKETFDPTKSHLGTIKVPDERLLKLKELFNPKKLTFAEIVFEDLPGFNVPQIKDIEAIMEVLGIFLDRDPVKDIENMNTEFMIADLGIIEKRLPGLEKELKQEKTRDKESEHVVLLKCKECLDKNTPLKTLSLNLEEDKKIKGFQFLTRKPLFILSNTTEGNNSSELLSKAESFSCEKGFEHMAFPAKLESEIADLDESEKKSFLEELEILEPARERVIKTAYKALGYITFFTVRGNETKAWPIKSGTTAIEGAGKVHSDIQRGFIKAEIVNFSDLVRLGSMQEARKKGLLRLESKEYKIKDGDIIDFKFNV